MWPTDGFHKIDPKRPTAPKMEGDTIEWIKFLNACIDEDNSTMKKVIKKYNAKTVEYLKEKGEKISSMDDIVIEQKKL